MLLAFRTVQLHTRSRSVPNTTSFLCPARRCPFNDTSQVRHFSSDSQSQQAPPPPRRSASSVALALLVLALPSAYWYYDSRSKQALSITRFVPCPITHIQPLTPQTSIFTVALPASFAQPPPTHALTALYVAQPEIQIQRPFTPLYPLTPESTHVQLLVKRYDEKGAEMSQYIHRQQVGDELLLRGPEVTWHIDPDAKHLSFVRGLSLSAKGCTKYSRSYLFADCRRDGRHALCSACAPPAQLACIQPAFPLSPVRLLHKRPSFLRSGPAPALENIRSAVDAPLPAHQSRSLRGSSGWQARCVGHPASLASGRLQNARVRSRCVSLPCCVLVSKGERLLMTTTQPTKKDGRSSSGTCQSRSRQDGAYWRHAARFWGESRPSRQAVTCS